MSFPHPKVYSCVRTTQPPSIDGDLDKPFWVDAPWSDAFVDILGDARPAPTLETRVKMLWDDAHFYIGARLTEPHVWATLTEHDSVIFHDNDFEMFVDPDGDNHDYGELEINALNTTWDLRLPKPYRDGGPALNQWEIAGLKTAVKIDGTINDPGDIDDGWSVEIAIPWESTLSLAGGGRPEIGARWRVNFSRVQWETSVIDGRYVKTPGRAEDNWVWSPQAAVDMHRPETWGYVRFVESATQSDETWRDETWPDRTRLIDAYYAARAARELVPGWRARSGPLSIDHRSRISPTISPEAGLALGALTLAAELHRRRWQLSTSR
jgi:hypothetical protein